MTIIHLDLDGMWPGPDPCRSPTKPPLLAAPRSTNTVVEVIATTFTATNAQRNRLIAAAFLTFLQM